MNVAIPNKKLAGKIYVPESKSMTHRYLICQALTPERVKLKYTNDSEDILATINCLNELGFGEAGQGPELLDRICRLNCANSASTYRFLLPIAAALGKTCEFTLGDSLSERPVEELLKALKIHGVKSDVLDKNHISITGRLTAGTFIIPGNISSQFISGLLFALPLLKSDSQIMVQGRLESLPYVMMTIKALEDSGIKVEPRISDNSKASDAENPAAMSDISKSSDAESPADDVLDGISKSHTVKTTASKTRNSVISAVFKVPGNQTYHLKKIDSIEGDWSQAAFFLTAGAVCGCPVTVRNAISTSVQGDKAIIEILENAGAIIMPDSGFGSQGGVMADSIEGSLKAFEVDMANIPDLLPPLAVLAAAAEGTSVFKNVARIHLKECDRVNAIVDIFNKLGVKAWTDESGNALFITGNKSRTPFTGGKINSFGDHRIAMMGAIMSCASGAPIVLENAEAVVKSYPGFYSDLKKLQRNR